MWRKSVLIILCIYLFYFADSRSVKKNNKKHYRADTLATSFDYDDIGDYIEPIHISQLYNKRRASARTTTTTTTERPIIRYWNTFVRNVRLPVPHVTWNITQPLTNLLLSEEPNVLESPVREQQSSNGVVNGNGNGNGNGIENYNNRRKTNKKKENIFMKESIEVKPYRDGIDTNKAMYFYDRRTDQIFAVQRIPLKKKKPILDDYSDLTVDDDVQAVLESLDSDESTLPTEILNTDITEIIKPNADKILKETTPVITTSTTITTPIQTSTPIPTPFGLDSEESNQPDEIVVNRQHKNTKNNIAALTAAVDSVAISPVAVVPVAIDTASVVADSTEPEIPAASFRAIGTYVKNDRWNRHKQRANNAKTTTKSVGRQSPQNYRVKYYFLNHW